MENTDYRKVRSIDGLEVTRDGAFRYKGKPKKALYCYTVTGRKATVRIMIMWDAKSHYWQAAKLVAEAWKFGYKDGDRITYKDGDCHKYPEPGDEPTEQREQSQTACRLSYAESRRRKADRPRAT